MKFSFVSLLLAALPSVIAQGTYTEQFGFGLNPSNTRMFTYVPDIIKGKTANRPLLVELHYCTGTAEAMYKGSYGGITFKELADQYGFVILYPENRDPGGCWEVNTWPSLINSGGGDSLGVASQTQHAINLFNLDASKVFATGLSSGASMALTLAAAYPNIYAGAVAYAGIPHTCFAGNDPWNGQCSSGNLIKTAQEWGNLVRNSFATWTGAYPKIQIWHGLNDEIFHPNLINEHVKQWTNVHGYPSTYQSRTVGYPTSIWTRDIFGPKFQLFTSPNLHTFGIETVAAAEYFGLLSPPPNPNPVTTTTPPAPGPTNLPQGRWQQCGGLNWLGCKFLFSLLLTTLTDGFDSDYLRDWPHLCLRGPVLLPVPLRTGESWREGMAREKSFGEEMRDTIGTTLKDSLYIALRRYEVLGLGYILVNEIYLIITIVLLLIYLIRLTYIN